MKQKWIAALALLSLCFAFVLISATPGRAQIAQIGDFPPQPTSPTSSQIASPSIGCAVQPHPGNSGAVEITAASLTLNRFRQSASDQPSEQSRQAARSAEVGIPGRRTLTLESLGLRRSNLSNSSSTYTPPEKIALADPTNYGDRFLNDLQGRPAYHDPIVVLHETVGSASSAINFFQTRHPRDEDQTSYHTLIARDGTIVYLVPPDKRAFGAGDSAFAGAAGVEAVVTNPDFPASVNNFAYHISLETPSDGDNNGDYHSGYTSTQYQSLAWLVAKTGVSVERLTTHKQVDQSGTRKDPRSFNAQKFVQLLDLYPKTTEIAIGCPKTVQ